MLMQQKRMVRVLESFYASSLTSSQVKFGLSTENLRAYVGMITEETLGFLSHELHASTTWQGFDALAAMSELTILTASRTLQGKEVRAQLDKTFAERYEHLDGGFTPINFMFPNLPLPSYRRRDKAQKAMSEFYQGIIRKRREGTHDVSTLSSD
jgi:sterol 14-demethylase